MKRIKTFSGLRPVLFSLALIISWFIAATIGTGIATAVTGIAFIERLPQTAGMLFATLYLVLVAWRFGWLRSAGIASPGNLRSWFVALIACIYFVLVYSIAFFGDLSLDIGSALLSVAGQAILARQIMVGIAEEMLFRGVVLYILIRVWGSSRGGLFLAVLLSAFLFGFIHLLQVFAGRSIGIALIAILEGIISGIWWGAFVVLWGTIWPAALLHTISNSFALVKGLDHPGLVFSYQVYSLAILFQIPLVILSLYLLLKTAPRPVIPDIP